MLLLPAIVSVVIAGCESDEGISFSVSDVSDRIQSVSSTEPHHEDVLTITGTQMDNVVRVFIGDEGVTKSNFTEQSETTVSFIVPTSVPVGENEMLVVWSGNGRGTVMLNIQAKPTPQIHSFTAFVPVGSNLTITGLQLDFKTTVTIDGIEAPIVSVSNTELVVTVPDGVNTGGSVILEITTDYGTSSSSVAFYARENLLANSQFNEGEGDDFTGWDKFNGGDNMTAVTGSEAYGGSGRSMRIVPGGGNAWDIQLASTGVPLTFGETYTVVLWAKADEAEGAGMRISASNPTAYYYGPDALFTSEWAQYIWTFEVSANLPDHRMVLDMGAYSVPFIIDHVALFEGVVGEGAGPGAAEELVNGSFEDGLTGWETLNGTHEVSTTEFFCGAASMTATGTGGDPWSVQIASDHIEGIVAGTDYEVSFWAKAAGPDGVFRISMSQYNSGDGSDFFYSPDLAIPEDWTYFSFVLQDVPDVASGVYRLLFDMGVSTQTFFVDGVSVKEYIPLEGSILGNGNFEDGLTGWETLNGTHEVSTTEFFSGTASMTATGTGGDPWSVQIASDHMADIVAGNTYKVSFWAKAAGPDGVFRISMSQYNSGDGSDFFYSSDLAIPEDWTYFSFVLQDVPAVASGVYRLLFDMGVSTQTFFVDDVSVAEYEACE